MNKIVRAAAAACLGIAMMTAGTAAQEGTATPLGECPATTADENVEIVQQYFEAVVAGDAETADSLLHDEYQHDLSTDMIEVPNEPGNADELENIDIVADVNHEVVAMIAQDDWVAVEWAFDLSGEHLEFEGIDAAALGRVDVMTFIRIECGTIAETHFASDIFRALLEHGFEIVPPGEGQ